MNPNGIRQPKQINLTDEDKQYQLDYWAALFKSTTWEDLKMLAQNNEYIRQASETIYQLSQEEAIRQQCEAREDYYRRQKGINDELAAKDNTIEELQVTVAEQKDTIEEQQNTIENLKGTIDKLTSEFKEFKALVTPLVEQSN